MWRHGPCFDQQKKVRTVTFYRTPSEHQMSLENIISVGLIGWLVVGMVLMGLDIW